MRINTGFDMDEKSELMRVFLRLIIIVIYSEPI